MDLVEWDRQRARWLRTRDRLRMGDVADDDFARAALAIPVHGFCARLLLLPADSESEAIEFTDDFWEWWKKAIEHPGGGRISWGSESRPTAAGAVLYNNFTDNECSYYANCLRSGGLDVAFGHKFSRELKESGILLLGRLVGAVWAACLAAERIRVRYSIVGPWEISIAIPQCKRLSLGGFGTGWAEPGTEWGDVPSNCFQQNVLLKCELLEAVAGWPESVAHNLGGRIEDAFGFNGRRFLACQGEHKGQIEPRHRQLP